MNSIQIVENELRIVEVIGQGPQGVKGDSGSGGSGIGLFIIEGKIEQAIPKHNGQASSELVLNLGTKANSALTCTDGVITVLEDIVSFHALVELQTTKSGGGVGILVVWAESSTDSGATWSTIPDSLRANAVNTDSEGVHNYDLSSTSGVPAGTKLRVVVSNAGSGNLSTNIPTLTTSNGTVNGKAAKTTIIY